MAFVRILFDVATMIPSSPSEEAPDSERRAFAALARLPDPWYVLHSVAWQSVRDGRQGDGEADFVLLHPSYGILIIEVKGGGIRVEGGQWYSIGTGGKVAIKDPFAQATVSKHALVRYLRASVEGTGSIPTGHAVAFPDIPSVDPLGPAAPPQIVVSRRELASPDQLVADLVAHWEMKWNASNETGEKIAALLVPTTHVRRLLVGRSVRRLNRDRQFHRCRFEYPGLSRKQNRLPVEPERVQISGGHDVFPAAADLADVSKRRSANQVILMAHVIRVFDSPDAGRRPCGLVSHARVLTNRLERTSEGRGGIGVMGPKRGATASQAVSYAGRGWGYGWQ